MLVIAALPAWAQETTFKKHYLNQTEVGIMLGRVKYDPYAGQRGNNGGQNGVVQNRTNLTLQLLNGIQCSPRFGLGVVTGWTGIIPPLSTPWARGCATT